jgi:hypothetical protein
MISASGGRTAARYIHNPAIPTLTHPAQHSLRTLHRDPQVDIEDGRRMGQVHLAQWLWNVQPDRVDDAVDCVTLADILEDASGLRGITRVGVEERTGESASGCISGDADDPVPLLGQDTGGRQADAATCARDKHRVDHRLREIPSCWCAETDQGERKPH